MASRLKPTAVICMVCNYPTVVHLCMFYCVVMAMAVFLLAFTNTHSVKALYLSAYASVNMRNLCKWHGEVCTLI